MIDELIARMDAIEEDLTVSGDRNRIFHGTYNRMTHAIRDEIRRGGFADSAWVERWDVAFAGYYLDALTRWRSGESPAAPWAVALEEPGDRTWVDSALTPFNRSGTKRFLAEARAKVWANTLVLAAERRLGPDAYAGRLAELEELAAAKVAELLRPGHVLLRLARRGFGVVLTP